MLRQLKQIFSEDMSTSFCSEKRLEKCVSATDISRFKPKKSQRTNEFIQPMVLEHKTTRTKELDQFLFCLKLKMIGIAGLFGDTEFDSQKIETKNANDILNELTRKIKVFQKESTRRVNQQANKNKALEIKIIHLQSYIQSLQSEQSHSRKQLQRNTKTHTIDIKKIESKVKEHQNEKEIIEMKLVTTNQLVDEQAKYIGQLETKTAELAKARDLMEKALFEKEKLVLKMINDEKIIAVKHVQQCEALKRSLMKKTEQTNKLGAEIKNLKQIIEGKDAKLEEMRKKTNKLYFQIEQWEAKFNKLSDQHNQLISETKKMAENYQINMEKMRGQLEQRIQTEKKSFKLMGEQVHEVRMHQHSIQTDVHWAGQQMDALFTDLQRRYQKQEQLLREEFAIEMRTVILDVQNFYHQHLMRLEDQNFTLRCQQKGQ